ncbi:zinc-dependent metalloprotease family protein [Pseudomonas sp. NPDC088429]|uniref:zinc-dependent metalloprotease family protein n=1 Tax=Pseudomonas sp. NPDC088429 TaxID=3364455 RepID=UPI003829E1B8
MIRNQNGANTNISISVPVMGLVMATVFYSASSSADVDNQLFKLEPAMERTTMQASARGKLAELLAAPTSADVRLVKVNPSLVASGTQEVSIPLTDDKSVSYHLNKFEKSDKGLDVWIGEVPSDRKKRFPSDEEVDLDSLNSATIVRDGDELYGTLRVAGQIYTLEKVENGQHVLVKVDESKFAPEGEPIVLKGVVEPAQPLGASPDTTGPIRVLIVTTVQSRGLSEAEIANAFSLANQANAATGIQGTFQYAGRYNSNYNETGDSRNDLGNLKNVNHAGLGVPTTQARNANRADMVALITQNAKDVCGIAFAGVAVDRTGVFSLTNRSCISNYTFHHELGHNMGGYHNWEPGAPVSDPSYANGYRIPGKFRTIMSYACTTQACSQINQWSSPRVTYQGVPLGTEQYHDVARRVHERWATVRDFYP